MNTGMKMMVLANRGGNAESKYRDRRGREHRENGEYAVRNYGGMDNREMDMVSGGYGGMEMGMDNMESRRRRDSQGRYMRSEWEDGMEENYGNDARMRGYPGRPFPVYEGGGYMNPIGFDPHREIETNYQMNATHHTGNEMEYKSNPKMGGGYSSGMSMPMTKETAEEWTKNMKNEDGTKGPHWTMEQVKQVMAQKGVKYDPVYFWVVLNMMYSDYCAVLKKHGCNNIDLYIDLAAAWLNDSDVGAKDKLSAYYQHVVNG